MRILVGALCLCACGRIGFDESEPLPLGKLALGTGGHVRRLALAGPTLDSFYALYGSSRLLRTDDGGATFTDCGFLPAFVTDIEADTTRVVAATSIGGYVSIDRCATFSGIGPTNIYLSTIALDGANLLAGSSTGLRRYTGTWANVTTPLTDFAKDILTTPVYLATSTTAVVRSTDGVNWTLATTGLASVDSTTLSAAGGKIVVSTLAGTHDSVDGGLTWTQRFPNGWVGRVSIDPSDPQFIAQWWSSGLAVTTNGGLGWVPDARTPNMARSRAEDFLFDPLGSGGYIVATGRGLYAADAHTVDFREVGNLDAWRIEDIAITASGARYLATPAGLLRLTSNGGVELLDPDGPSFSYVFSVHPVGDTIYAGGRTVARFDGRSFTELYSPDMADSFWVNDVTETNGTIVAATDTRVIVSTDGGSSWQRTTISGVRAHRRLLVLPTSPLTIFAAHDGGLAFSSDGGLTFTAALTKETFALAERDDGSILAGAVDGLYRAPSPGAPFTLYALGSRRVDVMLRDGPRLYVIADNMILYSDDEGATWLDVPGFTGHRPLSLAVEPSGTLLVGTTAWGVYRLPIP